MSLRPVQDPSRFEERLLTGWGRSQPTRASVVGATDEEDATGIFAGAKGRHVIARGLGRSYCDAAQCAGGVVVDLTTLRRLLELDSSTGVVRADAGSSIDDLLRISVPEGWFVPVTPGTRYVTLGGSLAADVHGKNHHRDGSFSAFVRSVRLAAPAGVFDLRPGDDPAAERDLFWASAGGMGLTGLFLEMSLQLLRIETSAILVDTERAEDLDDCMSRMDSQDADYRYSVAWIDCLAAGRHLGRGVLTRGNHASLSDIEQATRAGQRAARKWATDPLSFSPKQVARIPFTPPLRLLSKTAVRAFNEAWFRKAPKERRGELQSIPTFFHPLDGVGDWNRLYGPLGFTQYQCVVPFGAEDTIRYLVQALSNRQVPSFLAVLKRFGDAGPGHLSFPRSGWTLAVDIPLGLTGLAELLDDFDEKVASAGGRVYLAKDGRVRHELLQGMYPRLWEWRNVCDFVDPERQLESDLSRRLHLRTDAAESPTLRGGTR